MKRRLADNSSETLVGTDAMKLQTLRLRERLLEKRITDIETGKRTAPASELEKMRVELTEARRVAEILEEIVQDPSKCRRNKGVIPQKTEGIKERVGKIFRTFDDLPNATARA